jgi:hypothetical protein
VIERQWDDFGDLNLKKEVPYLDALCDGATSTALGAKPITLDWWADYEEQSAGNKKTATILPAPQTKNETTGLNTSNVWRFHIAASKFVFKFRFTIKGHTGDSANFINYQRPATQGGLVSNFYGSILRLLFQGGNTENRP